MDTILKSPKGFKLSGVKLVLLCALVIAFAYGCDQACFDKCTVNEDITHCGTRCGCANEAIVLSTHLKKTQRCYGD